MHADEIRRVLDDEARALVPHPPDLWPRVSTALARSQPRHRTRLRRWLGGLAAFVLAALAAAAALFDPLAGAAEDRIPAAAPVPITAMAATAADRPVVTPTPIPARLDDGTTAGADHAPTRYALWSLTPAPISLPASGLGLPAASFPSPAATLGR